jgi:hypothetical protein
VFDTEDFMTLIRTQTCGCLLLLSLWAVAVPAVAYAQGGTTTATLSGRVFDGTGGTLPGATVTVVNIATNQSRVVVTNEEGVYRLAGLTPGQHSLTAELQGFARFVQPEIRLNVGAAADLNVTMRVSDVAETITVTGEAPIVDRANTALTSVISRDQIDALPTNNRNYLDFALLTPGVAEDVRTAGQGIGLKFAGARGKEGSLLVDGLWNTDESFTFAKIKYSQDSIAEFQVVNIGAAPEFGRGFHGRGIQSLQPCQLQDARNSLRHEPDYAESSVRVGAQLQRTARGTARCSIHVLVRVVQRDLRSHNLNQQSRERPVGTADGCGWGEWHLGHSRIQE